MYSQWSKSLMHRSIASVRLNNVSCPFFPVLFHFVSSLCQLSALATDHWSSRGSARPGHPGFGDFGASPARGTHRPHHLCGAAAETGKKHGP